MCYFKIPRCGLTWANHDWFANAQYDLYNRLISAGGSFANPLSHNSSTYNLAGVVYGSSGEILEKNQSHILQGSSNPLNTYNNQYDYISSSHKISQIKDQISGRTEQFSYDLNGNVAQRVIPTLEYNYGWDEENRLRTFTKIDKLGETTHLYYYDASGERIIKIKGTTAKLFQDADLTSAQLLLRDFTIYPSAFLTQSDSKITKHYYAGTKRIASRIEIKIATEPRLSLDMELKAKQETDLKAIAKTLDCKEYKYEFNQYEAEADDEDTVAIRAEVPTPVFFYHPDHLGTSAVISNSAGAVHQYFFNLPFGETMIEGCTNTSYELNYKFNAKELDAESGLYYYGARYYDPRISVWMSVDPMWEKRNWISPFNYCQNNPYGKTDPTGALDNPIYGLDGNFLGTDDKGLQGVAIIMKKSDFKQGMSHVEAMEKGRTLDNMSDEQAMKFANNGNFENFINNFNELPNRPDYDGYLTKSEADSWWKGKSGLSLFVDQSKIELPGITSKDFDNNSGSSIYKNFIWNLSNTGKVYGTLKLTLLNVKTGVVHIGGQSYMDEYDYKMDDRPLRNFATWLGRPSGENSGKSFFIHGYGIGKVPVKE